MAGGHERPLMLVDVDGVLNVFGPSIQAMVGRTFFAQGFTIKVPVGTWDRIDRLSEEYDFIWATSWEHHAPAELAPKLGFGADWPIIKFQDGEWNRADTWKLPTIEQWDREMGGNRRLAWLDDDLWFPDVQQWADMRQRVLLLKCKAHTGLTDEHVEQALTWAQNDIDWEPDEVL